MKIFLVSNMFPSQDNPGFGVFVKNACDGMEEFGVHTEYKAAITGKGGSIITKFCKYIRFYISIISYYFKEYDCIYVHFPNHAAPLLNTLLFLSPQKIVVNYHGEDLLYNETSFLSRFLGKSSEKMAKKCSFVVVPSDYYKDIVIKKNLVDYSKIVVSPSGGIDTNIFRYIEDSPKRDYFHLGYVGRLEKDKGVLDFIEACDELSNNYHIKATIIGYGDLNSLVRKKTIDKSIYTVIFGVPQEELPAFYHDFDLFFFPSSRKTESLGLVGIEAMACGTPVIGGNIGGIKSYINHGVNGFLLRLDSLKDDMIKYSAEFFNYNEKERKDMVDNAVKTASLYSRRLVCEKLAGEFVSRI